MVPEQGSWLLRQQNEMVSQGGVAMASLRKICFCACFFWNFTLIKKTDSKEDSEWMSKTVWSSVRSREVGENGQSTAEAMSVHLGGSQLCYKMNLGW